MRNKNCFHKIEGEVRMKHEWRKHEKNLYMPKQSAELIRVPEQKFLMIDGRKSK